MSLILAYLSTVIASAGMHVANIALFYKDAADNGYKIDSERYKEFLEEAGTDIKIEIITFLTMFVNILSVLEDTREYNQDRALILADLKNCGVLVPMTKEEEEEYNKKPNALTAMKVNLMPHKQAPEDAVLMTIRDKETGEDSKIWFKLENQKLVVIKSEGPVSKKPISEQTEMATQKFKKILRSYDEFKFSAIKKIDKEKTIGLKADNDKQGTPNIHKPMSREEEKEKLKEIREILTRTVEKEEAKFKEKPKTKIKKK